MRQILIENSERQPANTPKVERMQTDATSAGAATKPTAPWLGFGLPALIGAHLALGVTFRFLTATGIATDERSGEIVPDRNGAVGSTEPGGAGAPAGEVAPGEVTPGHDLGPAGEEEDGIEDEARATDADGPSLPENEEATAAEGGDRATAGNDRERGARDRPRRRQRAAEDPETGESAEGDEDRYAGLGPLVRHLGLMTRELSEAQRTVGRLTAERDALLRQIGQRPSLPVAAGEDDPAPPIDQPRPNKEARIEAKAAKQAERAAIVPMEAIDPELANRAEQVGRRRRLIALAVLAVLVAGFVIARQMNYDLSTALSRGGLAHIAYIGPFLQIFLAGWLIYRIAKISGKGAKWLFPGEEQQRKRRK